MSDSGSSNARGWTLALGALLIAVLCVAWLGPGAPDHAYDLDDASGTGTKALRLTFEELGSGLEITPPTDLDTFDSVIVPVPGRASVVETVAWRRFAEQGGTLILAAPADIGLGAQQAEFDPGLDPMGQRKCDIPVVSSMTDLEVEPTWASDLEVRSGDRSCFGDGDSALVVAEPLGDGWVVTLNDQEWITNLGLRGRNDGLSTPSAENFDDRAAVLLALAQIRGSELPGGAELDRPVGYVQPWFVAKADRSETLTFWSFVRPSVKAGLAQLIVAVLIFAWYSARRLGRVVPEPQPVNIAGADLVEAVGEMMRRRRDPDAALAVLRRTAIGDLGTALHLGSRPDPGTLVVRAAAVSGMEEAEVRQMLYTATASDSAVLLRLANQIDRLRMEIVHGNQRI